MAALAVRLSAKRSWQRRVVPQLIRVEKTHEAKACNKHGKHAEAKRKSKNQVRRARGQARHRRRSPATFAGADDAIALARKGKTDGRERGRRRPDRADPAGQKLADWLCLRHSIAAANSSARRLSSPPNPDWAEQRAAAPAPDALCGKRKFDAATVQQIHHRLETGPYVGPSRTTPRASFGARPCACSLKAQANRATRHQSAKPGARMNCPSATKRIPTKHPRTA